MSFRQFGRVQKLLWSTRGDRRRWKKGGGESEHVDFPHHHGCGQVGCKNQAFWRAWFESDVDRARVPPPPSSISCDHSAVDQPDFDSTWSGPDPRSAARKRAPIRGQNRPHSLLAGQAAPTTAGSTSRRDRDAVRFLLWIRLPPHAPASPPPRHCDIKRRNTVQRPYEVLSVPRIDVSNSGGTCGPSSTLPSACLPSPYPPPSSKSNPAGLHARSGKSFALAVFFY